MRCWRDVILSFDHVHPDIIVIVIVIMPPASTREENQQRLGVNRNDLRDVRWAMIFSYSSSSIVLRVFLISFQKEGNDSNEDARANTRTPRSSGSSPIKTAARPSRTQPRVNKKSIYISDLPLSTKKRVIGFDASFSRALTAYPPAPERCC